MTDLKPEFISIPEKKLIGISVITSVKNNQIKDLWQRFIPRLKKIRNRKNSDLYSIQEYDPALKFNEFTAETQFKHWAAAEVTSLLNVPEGLQTISIPAGKYVVFTQSGNASSSAKAIQSIYREWLPKSGLQIDNRPHFQVMEKDYRPEDPDATETFWIPLGYFPEANIL